MDDDDDVDDNVDVTLQSSLQERDACHNILPTSSENV